ncbi:Hypothetical protein SMAX5B_003355 [Scophthalmus maximus]|uniref:Uncharacterized protein n=1 Tax=Scophthalmus maximus TaxID=52904 RepID=A0A2U9BJA0_SCOMX|nr:Hypothetical protein SMAX5B_003355 [Scophthalmus maximus]
MHLCRYIRLTDGRVSFVLSERHVRGQDVIRDTKCHLCISSSPPATSRSIFSQSAIEKRCTLAASNLSKKRKEPNQLTRDVQGRYPLHLLGSVCGMRSHQKRRTNQPGAAGAVGSACWEDGELSR